MFVSISVRSCRLFAEIAFLIAFMLCDTTRAQDASTSPGAPPDLGGATITLERSIELALLHSPSLAVYDWDVRIAEARLLQARVRPNPDLSFAIEDIRLSRGPDSTTTSGEIGTGGLSVSKDREDGGPSGFQEAESTLTLSQLIELGGKRAKRIRAAEKEIDTARWDYEVARADTLTEVAKRFGDVIAAQERLELFDESVSLASTVRETVRIRVDAGRSSAIEGDRVQIQLDEAEIARANEQRKLQAARHQLAASFGATVVTFGDALGDFLLDDPPAPFETLEGLLSDLPDLARWIAELERRSALLASERARRVPDLTASLGFRSRGVGNRDARNVGLSTVPELSLGRSHTSYDERSEESLLLEFSLPLPLFDRNQGGIKEAEHQIERAGAAGWSAGLRVHTTLRAAYEELLAAHDEATALANDVVPLAQSTFESVNIGYQEGKFGYLEVLDAQRALITARSQHIEALARYHRARIDLERLTGESSADPREME